VTGRPRSNQFPVSILLSAWVLTLRSAWVWRGILVGLLVSMLLGACTQTPTPTVETFRFRLALDASTAPLVEELVAAYRAERPQVTIELVRAQTPSGRCRRCKRHRQTWSAFPGCPRGKKRARRHGIVLLPETLS